MLARSLGVFASLAIAASSVLIPPSVAGVDNSLSDEIWSFDPSRKHVVLECDSCPSTFFDKESGDLTFYERNESVYYVLSFTTSEDQDALFVQDSYQLYPPVLAPITLDDLTIEQRDTPEDDGFPVRVTSFTLQLPGADTVSEEGYELLHMTFQIIAINGRDMNPPAIDIYVIKDIDGRLTIASLKTSENIYSSLKPHTKSCEQWPLLCKWKSMLADKVNGLKSSGRKGCGKFKGKPNEIDGFHGKLPGHLRPGFQHMPHVEEDGPHGRPHHGHGHGHGHGRHGKGNHGVQRFFRRAFFTVLLPILVGIFAGTLTYLIGMALGCVIAMVIAKVRGQDAYVSLPQDEEQNDGKTGGDSEKEVYSELPQYEAPPVYEEATEKEVVNEAH